MATKSIIEIDVLDDPFKDFQKRWEKYQEQLKSSPSAWKASSSEIKKTNGEVNSVVNNIVIINNGLNKNKKALEDANRTWSSIGKGTKTVAANIKDATTSLLKWASLTSVFSGLLGAGGLMGIGRLAAGAGDRLRQSQGLGMSTSGMQAAQTNFGRAVDVNSVLSSIRDIKNDPSRQWAFGAAGVNQNKSPDELLGDLIKSAKKMQGTSGNKFTAEATGLTNFFSMDELERFKSMSDAQIDSMIKQTAADKKTLEINEKTQQAWQDLDVQLHRSGQTIENIFLSKLVGIAGPLDKLSAALAASLNTILSDPKLPGYIDSFGKSLEDAAKYLGTNDFKNNVKSFIDDVSGMAHGIHRFLEITGLSGSGDKASSNKKNSSITGFNPAWWNLYGKFDTDYQASRQPTSITSKKIGQSSNNQFGSLEGKYGLPSGIMAAQRKIESGGNDRAISPAGAKGAFQFMDSTAAQYGVKDPFNLEQAALGNAKMMHDLLGHFHDNVKNALAAYNWGVGNVDKYLKSNTSSNGTVDYSKMPAETQKYIGSTITIMNNTGGNAVVSMGAIAQ